MRAGAIGALVLLLAALAPAVSAADVEVTQVVTVEVEEDLSETVEWELSSEGGYVTALALPPDIDVRSVRDGEGDRIEHDVDDEADGTTLEIEGMHTEIVVRFTRAAPSNETHPLYGRRIVVAEYDDADNDIKVTVRVPAGHRLFWMSGGTIASGGLSATARTDDAGLVTYSYEAPVDAASGTMVVSEGIFRLFAPAGDEASLRESARVATNATREAAAVAGLPVPATVRVRFGADGEFGAQEGGHYSNDGIVAIRQSYVGTQREHGAPWRLAAILTHEAFHALSVPDGTADQGHTWWVEGTARFAERFVTGLEPWSDPDCACYVHDPGQLSRRRLISIYEDAPDPAPYERQADGFPESGYEYGAFLVASYIDRYGIAAYREAWQDFRSRVRLESCACDDAMITRILIAKSDGAATSTEIHFPFRELFESDRAAFDEATTTLVAEGDVLAEPTPLRYLDGTLAYVARSPGMGWRPTIVLGGDEAQVRAQGAFEVHFAWTNATLAGVPVDDNRPVANVTFQLDGVNATPRIVHELGYSRAIFDNASVGERNVTAQLRDARGTLLSDAAEASFVVRLTARPVLALLQPAPGAAPPFLVAAQATSADLGEPLAGVDVALEIDGEVARTTRSADDGIAYFELVSLPRPGAEVALAAGEERIPIPIAAPPPSPSPSPASAPASGPAPAPDGQLPSAVAVPADDGRAATPGPFALLAALLGALLMRRPPQRS